MATAQYLTELAVALAERGHQVTVVTGRRAYDNPDQLFPARETWRGLRIHRVGATRFGKAAKWRRAADFASFLLACCWRLLRLPRQDVVVALTSPPLISFLAAWFSRLRGGRFCYWVMDLNPDEALAAGWLRPGSVAARWLEHGSRFSFRRAARIIALDHFMRDRIGQKGIAPDKITVIPPWSHDDEVRFDAAGRQRFRTAHGLTDKFVVMYSGNHSPCHPLDTVLRAAQQLADDPDIQFCFVGGGSEWRKISERLKGGGLAVPHSSCVLRHAPPGAPPPASGVAAPAGPPSPATRPPPRSTNLRCLPYQPLDQLAASLSAADVHLVVMGDPFVGIIHPCKIYNILSVGAPVLYVGPPASHVTEILDALGNPAGCGRAEHGDADTVAQTIRRLKEGAVPRDQSRYGAATAGYAKASLLPQLVAVLESLAPTAAAPQFNNPKTGPPPARRAEE